MYGFYLESQSEVNYVTMWVTTQGSYMSWKTWKTWKNIFVMEMSWNFIFLEKSWKCHGILQKCHGKSMFLLIP